MSIQIPFKNKEEKLEYIKQDIIQNSKLNIQRAQNITLNNSLVKYDTPFLVSSTTKNKKTLQDLEENDEEANLYLRNIIFSNNKKGNFTENIEFRVKDALNKILPPKKITDKEKIWVQYVTCSPVTKAEVINLQDLLDRRLQTEQARETGICPIREQLYNECFDELIRQVTINCLERGILLLRIKKEINMTITSYQSLYDSSIAYGIRTLFICEEEKKIIEDKIQKTQEEIDELESDIEILERDFEEHKNNDIINREELKQNHLNDINALNDEIKKKKEKLTAKLAFYNK